MDKSISIEMDHNQIVNRWIGFVSGVAGGGIHLSLLTATLNWLSFAQAMFTAFFCGAAGVAGKHFFDFVKSKFKSEGKALVTGIKKTIKRRMNK